VCWFGGCVGVCGRGKGHAFGCAGPRHLETVWPPPGCPATWSSPLHHHHYTTTITPPPLHHHHYTTTITPPPLHHHHYTTTTITPPPYPQYIYHNRRTHTNPQQVVANARALGEALKAKGYKLVTDGTDNHLLLWDLRGEGISGAQLSHHTVCCVCVPRLLCHCVEHVVFYAATSRVC
jgi:Serine hydroxymethyltransferase